MNCGQTELPVGTKVRVKHSTDKEDIGLTGTATHPFAFGCTDKGWIGIYLDDIFAPYLDSKMNSPITDIEIITE
jgi:hypothetical protein